VTRAPEKTLSEREIEAVTQLDPAARSRYCIEKIVDWEWVWTVPDATARAPSEQRVVPCPIWPFRRFAEACSATSRAVVAMPVREFVRVRLPTLDRSGIALEIFPTPASPGHVAGAVEVERNLREAWARALERDEDKGALFSDEL
jgi:hypothetical protein